jgi:hypothetical protein
MENQDRQSAAPIWRNKRARFSLREIVRLLELANWPI